MTTKMTATVHKSLETMAVGKYSRTMLHNKVLNLPHQILNQDDLTQILYGLSDYIGIHELIFDDFDEVQDAHLIWWNAAYEKIRTKEVILGQSMAETYFDSHVAFVHVTEAWRTGHSYQVFEMEASARDRYREGGKRIKTLVNWQRVGNYIVESGGDVGEFVALEELLNDQQSLVAIASKKRALAAERERIAHNLHDSTIQELYALSLSLSLSAAKPSTEEEMLTIKDNAVRAIGKVIEGIRREILDVESQKISPLRLQLEDVLLPIITPNNTQFTLDINVPRIDDEFLPHIRAVCTEATSNAVRHGGARSVAVVLKREQENLVLTISDDGTGIDPSAPLQNGLKNMRERAQSLGGTMTIESKIGTGVRLTWSVPHIGWTS